VVLSGDESREVADDKLAEAAADAVKRNGVLTNQLEVHTTTGQPALAGTSSHRCKKRSNKNKNVKKT